MKETTMVIVDITQDLFEEDKKKLKIIFNILAMIAGSNILYGHKTDDLAVIFLNTKNSNEKNIEFFINFSQASFQGLRDIRQYYEQVKIKKSNQDIFFLLNEIKDLFTQYYKEKKYKKKIYIITSGNFKNVLSNNEIKKLGQDLYESKIFTNIISIDFWTDQDEVKFLLENGELNRTQIQNINRIKVFLEFSQNYSLIFDHNLSIKILQDFKTIKTNKICLYKGDFVIAPNCKLQVQIFSKVKQRKFPFLNKYSKMNQFNDVSKNKINMETIYFNPEDPQMKQYSQKNITKGYFYGQQIIPIDNQQQDQLKLQGDKCLQLLGFIKKQKIKHFQFMSETECIYPSLDSDQQNQKAFNSIVQSLIKLEKVCIVRYVKKNNSSPLLVALFPQKKQIQEEQKIIYYLYLVQLPTIEDLREYSFGSLINSNDKQRQLMSQYIDRMNIENFEDENGTEKELLNPEQTYNPSIQILMDNVMQRGVTGSDNKIQIRKEILDYVNTEQKTYKKIEYLEDDIIEQFHLNDLKGTEKKQQKLFWNDILQQKLTDKELLIQKMKEDKEKNVPRQIGKNYPISDFREMLNYRKEDLAEEAIAQMQNIIMEMITSSVEGSTFGKAIECLQALRDGCVNEEEADKFNSFLISLKKILNEKKQYSKFWQKLTKYKKISLIYNQEVDRSNFTQQHSQLFLQDNEFFGNIKELTNLGNLKTLAEDLD